MGVKPPRCSLFRQKIQYKTREKAERYAAIMQSRFMEFWFHAYECPSCKMYHVGRYNPRDPYDEQERRQHEKPERKGEYYRAVIARHLAENLSRWENEGGAIVLTAEG